MTLTGNVKNQVLSAKQRSSHTKSRNGCLRCKAKRVKCDEGKPACSRCLEREISCPGYRLNIRWSAPKHKDIASSTTSQSNDQPSPPRPSPPSSASISEKMVVAAGGEDMASPNTLLLMDSMLEDQQMQLSDPLPALELCSSTFYYTPSLSKTDSETMHGQQTVLGHNFQSPSFQFSSTSNLDAVDAWPTQNDLHSLPLPNIDCNDKDAVIELVDTEEKQDLAVARPRAVSNLPTVLCSYFFEEIITLYCTWDGKANYMRNMSQKWWQSSGILFHTIQSMSALFLSRKYKHLAGHARQQRSYALQYLGSQAYSQDTVQEDQLFAMFLLGHTASWHDPMDLALRDWKKGKVLLNQWSFSGIQSTEHTVFFQGAMEYWTMMLAYLVDGDVLQTLETASNQRSSVPTVLCQEERPHPWSGLHLTLVEMIRDVGFLVSRHRNRWRMSDFVTEQDLQALRDNITTARMLERRLLNHVVKYQEFTHDLGDPQTSLDHFRIMGEAYRCTGLLQLYRTFPDLLIERYNPWDERQILQALPASKRPTPRERQVWLTSLALHILDMLRKIPFESHTRSIQPFIMVAIAGELRCSNDAGHQSVATSTQAGFAVSDHGSIDIALARDFINMRLAAYSLVLPLMKVYIVIELVHSIWKAIDQEQKDIHWVDIARSSRLGTIMG